MSDRLKALRAARPLVHCVANTVSSESCANLLLALGASPIMAHAPEEMAAVTAAAQATVLNTGTPDAVRWSACRTCLRAADHPVVLDPVGVGVSPWRKTAIRQLLAIRSPAILRVNAGEAQTLLGMDSRSQGVDCPKRLPCDQATALAQRLARLRHCVVLLTGALDAVSDGQKTCCIAGGNPLMSRITGSGDMLSCLCGAFATVTDAFTAAVTASAFWKLCAERAAATAPAPGCFRAALIDNVYIIDDRELAAAMAGRGLLSFI
ncbi:hydroxyethylthiazole kinase [Pseudoramibacter alactolyticus]|uniref:hydroxyethylthiazole kinase n=1 Tax=Pseudoramibacter alactolyticus TaxID=113287 RepID=UPI002354B6FD|nr:hydroxyethylthiazole kinase [Pseudoramibacter alactolyticus]MBM6969439.1 hydroxyethylthiazole kinase [Pseudoramibacter alactolyticus]